MILPPHIAKYVTHFKIDYNHDIDKNHNNICNDIYVVYFSKLKSFFGFKYRKEWNEEYKFARISVKKAWQMSESSTEFRDQMNLIQQNNWTLISPETYKKIQKDHPEYLL